MRHARVMGLAGLAVLAVGAVAFAQTTVVPVPDNAPVETAPLDINLAKTTWGDAKAGQTKAAACAACHGADGNAPIDASYPKLGGQYADYIEHSLQAYRSGDRGGSPTTDLMGGQAKGLTDQQIADLAAYFSSATSTLRDLHGAE